MDKQDEWQDNQDMAADWLSNVIFRPLVAHYIFSVISVDYFSITLYFSYYPYTCGQ